MAVTQRNGFWSRVQTSVISGAILVFFGWLAWAVVEISRLSERLDERTILMSRQITALVSAEKARTDRRIENNTERLDDIQENAQ